MLKIIAVPMYTNAMYLITRHLQLERWRNKQGYDGYYPSFIHAFKVPKYINYSTLENDAKLNYFYAKYGKKEFLLNTQNSDFHLLQNTQKVNIKQLKNRNEIIVSLP